MTIEILLLAVAIIAVALACLILTLVVSAMKLLWEELFR
jgi:hypothetical protein